MLSHLNMVPLAEGRATFTLKEVESAVNRATDGPFPLQIGAISIECPVAQKTGRSVPIRRNEEDLRIREGKRH